MTTRRTFLSFPALAALLSPAVAFARSTRDPIFSRIEAHRAACDLVNATIDALAEAEASCSSRLVRAATRAEGKAHEQERTALSALMADPPETVEGAQALAAYLSGFVASDGDTALGDLTSRAFAGIALALSAPRAA
jgi:hypothetical protein